MAKYIKQEVPDMQKTGEQKAFYRLKVERNIDFEEFIQRLCSYHRGISRGEALRVLTSASDVLAELLGEGYFGDIRRLGHLQGHYRTGRRQGNGHHRRKREQAKRPQPSPERSELSGQQETGAERKPALQAGTRRHCPHPAFTLHERRTLAKSARLSG